MVQQRWRCCTAKNDSAYGFTQIAAQASSIGAGEVQVAASDPT
jgi:hypothetical protein